MEDAVFTQEDLDKAKAEAYKAGVDAMRKAAVEHVKSVANAEHEKAMIESALGNDEAFNILFRGCIVLQPVIFNLGHIEPKK